MCMVDDADGYWGVWSKEDVRARKPHRCYECRREIVVGETYERSGGYLKGDWEGWEHYKTCAHCVAARQWLIVQCGGYLYGGVEEDLQNHWDEEWLLRSRWLGEAIIGMRRKWQHHGELMPVLGPPPKAAVAA